MGMTAFEIFGVLRLDTSEFKSSLSGAQSAATSFGSVLSGGLAGAAKIGLGAITAAAGAVTAFGGAAVATGSAFDQAMGGVAATLGKTVDSLESDIGDVDTAYGHFSGTLREFAMFMGQNTTFSATQAASALNYMALAGYNTQQSMEMLPSVLSMAAAGGMDLALASDMITDTQSALGISFERTGTMVNEFAKAASTGNTSVEQLGEAMLRVGGLGAELNGGIVTLADGTQAETDNVQELEIAFTAMANAGIKGSEAGTHMRNMLLKLASPTKDGAEAFEKLGVSIFDEEGKMRSLGGIMGDLGTALNSLTQQEKLQAISDIFNTRDTASAEALMAAMGDDWNRIGAAILNAGDAADEMSKTKLNNLAGDMTFFKSALESAYITINDQLSPTLRKFVQFGTSGVQELATAFTSTYNSALEEGGSQTDALSAALTSTTQSLGDLLSEGLNNVATVLPNAVNLGIELLGAIGNGILQNLPTITSAAVAVGLQLVTGLVDAVSALADNADEIMDAFAQAFEENSEQIHELGAKIMQLLVDGLTIGIPELLSFATDMFTQLTTYIGENSQEIATTAATIVEALAMGLAENLPAIMTGIAGLAASIATAITDPSVLTPIISGASSIILALAQGLLEALPLLISAAPTVMENLMTGLVDNMPMILETVIQLIGMIVEVILQNLPLIISAAIQVGFALITGLLSMVPAVLEAILSLMAEIAASILASAPDMVAGGVQIVGSIIEGIVSMFETMITNAIGLVTAFISGITKSAQKIIDAGKTIVEKVKEGITSKIEEAKQWGIDLISNFVGGITSGWEKLKGAIGGAAQVVADNIGFSEPKEGPLSNFHTFAPDMMELFSEGIRDNAYLVRDEFAKSLDFGTISSSLTATGNGSEVISLLRDIRDGGMVNVSLEGDADRLFRMIQHKANVNYRLTGQGVVTI